MSAYVIVHATIKDAEKMKEYAQGAGATVAAHGGEFVARAMVQEVLTGKHDHQRFVLIRFPDAAAARAWYNSADYQALVAVRDAGADADLILAEEPSA